AAAGADFVGLNPLHALFLPDPARCSPISPSNRRYLNPLYIAVDQLAGFEPAMVDEGALARLREAELVDYAGVTRLKLDCLRQIWQRTRPATSPAMDRGVQQHALFEALSLHMNAAGMEAGWPGWPAG